MSVALSLVLGTQGLGINAQGLGPGGLQRLPPAVVHSPRLRQGLGPAPHLGPVLILETVG